jgi:hypothetical protein
MTAVEWLIEQYMKDGLFKEGVYEKAKEIEKQNVKNGYGDGIETMRKSFSVSSHIPKGAEEYYNETFNK